MRPAEFAALAAALHLDEAVVCAPDLRLVLSVRTPFEQLRTAAPKAAKRDERQLAFIFAIEGGRVERLSGDVVASDPSSRLAGKLF